MNWRSEQTLLKRVSMPSSRGSKRSSLRCTEQQMPSERNGKLGRKGSFANWRKHSDGSLKRAIYGWGIHTFQLANIRRPLTHAPVRHWYGRKAAELAALHWSKTVNVQRGRTCLAYALRTISCRLCPHRRRAAIMRQKLRPHKHCANLRSPDNSPLLFGFGLLSPALSAALLA